MSNAEIFLIVWAGIATALAVMYRESAKRYMKHQMATAELLSGVVVGDVVAVKKDGLWIVENDNIKVAFKRKDA